MYELPEDGTDGTDVPTCRSGDKPDLKHVELIV